MTDTNPPFAPFHQPKPQAMRIEIDPENLNGLLRPVIAEINEHTQRLKNHDSALSKIMDALTLLVADYEARRDDGK